MANDEDQGPRLFPGVMLSSTFKELKEHRRILMDALRKQDLFPIGMEDYTLRPDDDIISSSLRMVGKGSAYIGLISHRCGQIIEDANRNPHSYSISRLEFEEAQRLGLPTMIFIMGDDHQGSKDDFETDPIKVKTLAEYRERAEAKRIYAVFENLAQFTQEAIHAAANLRQSLESRPKESSPKAAVAPAVALIDEVAALEEPELVKSLLEERWDLAGLVAAIGGRTPTALELIRILNSTHSGTWSRLLGAYLASKIQIPAKGLIELAFSAGLYWGARCAILTLLRFTPRSKMSDAVAQLVAAAEESKLPGLDAQRLMILGLGYLEGHHTIYGTLKDFTAFQAKYANEKLGPYALLAYLHCYIGATTASDERYALRAFTEIAQANQKHGNDGFVFFDFADELQTLRPGKAVALFRHLRDQGHHTALGALLAQLQQQPNPLLAPELVELGTKTVDETVAAGALHAAAFIGTPEVENGLREAADANRPGAYAALLLCYGIRRNGERKDKLEEAVRKGERDASWLNDHRGNAIWSVGELGRDDPSFAQRVLTGVTRDPEDAYGRGLAYVGLAKAGLVSKEQINLSMEAATGFYERMAIALAGALSGWPEALASGLQGMIENAGPPYRLLAHIQRDLRTALNHHAGAGGRALVTLWDMGDFN